jgi:hypothetical protein
MSENNVYTTTHRPIVDFKYNKKIILKSSDVRIYKDVVILTPGEWSDAMTQSPVVYTDLELEKGSRMWSKNFLNIDHSWGTLDRIGYVRNPYYHRHIGVMGDLHIYPITERARDTIALIDAGLVNWLSAEIATQDIWNGDEQKRYATQIEFIGCAVVTSPACGETRIR